MIAGIVTPTPKAIDSPADPAVCTMLFSRIDGLAEAELREQAEEGDGDDRDRDRRAHRQADLQHQVERRGAEDHAEERADDQRQDRQLGEHHGGRDERPESRHQRILRGRPDDVGILLRGDLVVNCHCETSQSGEQRTSVKEKDSLPRRLAGRAIGMPRDHHSGLVRYHIEPRTWIR